MLEKVIDSGRCGGAIFYPQETSEEVKWGERSEREGGDCVQRKSAKRVHDKMREAAGVKMGDCYPR